MPSVFRDLHTVNSAAKLSSAKLESEGTLILTPSISVFVLEDSISFPWQWNTNQQKTVPYSNLLFNYARRSGMGVCVCLCVCLCVCVWQSVIFYTENTIQTRHFNGNAKKRQAAFKRELLKLSQHSPVIRGTWAGWNCLTLSTAFVCIYKYIFFLDFPTFEGCTHCCWLNIGKEISLFFSLYPRREHISVCYYVFCNFFQPVTVKYRSSPKIHNKSTQYVAHCLWFLGKKIEWKSYLTTWRLRWSIG